MHKLCQFLTENEKTSFPISGNDVFSISIFSLVRKIAIWNCIPIADK